MCENKNHNGFHPCKHGWIFFCYTFVSLLSIMISLSALQFAIPLILVLWIAVAPPRGLLGFWIQVVATATVLFAVGLAGLWTILPWWSPYAFGCLLLPAILVGLRRRQSFASVLPLNTGGWTLAVLFLALGGVAIYQAALALRGRAPSQAKPVELAFPLKGGTYLIVNGGSDLSINAHLKTLDVAVPRFRAWRGQSYGIDIVKIDRIGLRANGLQPAEPDAYRIYGAQVLAPCAGEIVAATDNLPDMRVPETDRAHMAGNHVRLHCGDAEVLLGHLRPGSIEVAVGTRVRVGDRIAAAGNSGNSDEPHLHIHAQQSGTVDEPMSGNPLPMSFNGHFLVRNDRVSVP
jgi:hypothetical protein